MNELLKDILTPTEKELARCIDCDKRRYLDTLPRKEAVIARDMMIIETTARIATAKADRLFLKDLEAAITKIEPAKLLDLMTMAQYRYAANEIIQHLKEWHKITKGGE